MAHLQRLLTAFLLLFTIFLAGSALAEESREWKKVTDKNGIQVYRAHTDDSKMKTFRGISRMWIDDLRVFMAIIDDESELSDWMHMISRVKLVGSDNPNHRLFYVETRLPWPVKDRDVYIDVDIQQADDYSINAQVTQAENMPPPERGYVRMPEIEGKISIDAIPDSADVVITYEMILDPGGYIPAWMVNLITADVPYFTLKKMKKVITLEKYQDYETDIILRRPWVEAVTDN